MRHLRKSFLIPAAVVLCLLVLGLILFGRRGTVRATLFNDLDCDIELSAVQNVPVHETVRSHQSTDFQVRLLGGSPVVSVRLIIQGQVFEKDILEYSEPAYRGTISVRITRSETGEICFDIDPQV